MNKKFIFLFLGLLLTLVSLSFVSAELFNVHSATPNYINRTVNTVINFTLNNTGVYNITQVIISLPQDATFYAGSNGTDASGTNFTSASTNLIWTNTSGAALIENVSETKNFWFNASFISAGNKVFTIIINDTESIGNITTQALTVNFAFSGFVKNETGSLINGTNISIYQFVISQTGPPTEILTGVTTVTNKTQGFTFTSINGSADNYKLKLVHYNSSGSAIKVSTILPPFPAMIYYPMSFDSGTPEFMKPPTLNGTTFYVEPAATINITAIGNYSYTAQLFGYEIMEQKTGFPIASNVKGNVSSVQIAIPLNRDYTVMALREPSQFGSSDACNGTFMNNTLCPAAPKSNSTISPTIAGQLINVQFNFTTTDVYLYGCIGVSGNSSPVTNITFIIPKLLPWPGFVPPGGEDSGDVNLTDGAQLNHSVEETPINCSGKVAYYNISLMTADYLIEFYGKNASLEDNATWFAAFQNVSSGGMGYLNITLLPLAGEYTAGGDLNTSKITIRFVNSSGAAITSDTPHADLYLKHSSFNELHYIPESLTNGSFSMPILANATARIMTYPNQAPPTEKKLNLSLAENNITIVTMTGGDMGFRKVNASGQLEEMNVTDIPIQMRFLRSGVGCDVVTPSSPCEITSMTQDTFNPLKALVAGKINMEMKLTTSGVTLLFFNYDMFSAKQPPLMSEMNDQASSGGSTAAQIWEFGSYVPADVYDYVVIGIPYSDSVINDSADISIIINSLYDYIGESQKDVVWNTSRGDTTANLTTEMDRYLGNVNNRSYNSTGYRNFLTTSGVTCSKTISNISEPNAGGYCYVNTTANMLYMRVPHFTGSGINLAGTAPGTGTTPRATSGGTPLYWKTTHVVTEEQFKEGFTKQLEVKERMKVTVSGESHYIGVVELTSTTATINVTSAPQQATLSVGGEEKFDVIDDNYYDISVKLDGIANSKANITILSIHDEIPVPVECTPSWSCTDWSDCINGTKTRTCADSNNCGTDENKPEESKTCGIEAIKEKGIALLIPIIIIIVIAVAVVFYLLYKKKRYKIKGY